MGKNDSNTLCVDELIFGKWRKNIQKYPDRVNAGA